jgi:hypothetical protein
VVLQSLSQEVSPVYHQGLAIHNPEKKMKMTKYFYSYNESEKMSSLENSIQSEANNVAWCNLLKGLTLFSSFCNSHGVLES